MKDYFFLIKDSSKGRARVCQMGPNGEMISQSEPLNSLSAVYKNILASSRVTRNDVPPAKTLKTENNLKRAIKDLGVSVRYRETDFINSTFTPCPTFAE